MPLDYGCTAVVAVYCENRTLAVASAGDSPALLFRCDQPESSDPDGLLATVCVCVCVIWEECLWRQCFAHFLVTGLVVSMLSHSSCMSHTGPTGKRSGSGVRQRQRPWGRRLSSPTAATSRL